MRLRTALIDLGRRAARWPLVGRAMRLLQGRTGRIWLRVAVVLVVMAFVSYAVHRNWSELEHYEWSADYRYVLLAVAVFVPCYLTVLLAWHAIMSSIGATNSLRLNAEVYCLSSLPKRIPGVVWYIASRVQLYRERGVAGSITLVGTLLETVLLIVSALLVYLLSLLVPSLTSPTQSLRPAVALALLLPLLAVLHPAVFNRGFGLLLRKLRYEGRLALTWGRSLRLVAVYLPAWILGGIDLFILANAIHPVSVRFLPAVIGAWAASSAVSFVAGYLVQGLGIAEVTLAALLSSIVPLPVGLVISLCFRVLLTLGDTLLALALAWAITGFKGIARNK